MPDTVEMKDALVSQIKRFKSDSQIFNYDEQKVKQGVILRILSILGWDTFDVEEVCPEYSVSGGRVDYSLRINGENKIFVEAKKPAEDLDSHSEQLLKYAIGRSIGVAILTNGIIWKFYLSSSSLEDVELGQRIFYTINISTQHEDDVSQRFIEFLSKEKVRSGEAKQNAINVYRSAQQRNALRENIPKAWKKIISGPDALLVDLIKDYTEDLCGFPADEGMIREFLEELQGRISIIERTKQTQTTGVGPVTQGPPILRRTRKKRVYASTPPNAPVDPTGREPSKISFDGNQKSVKYWCDLLVEVLGIVADRKGREFSRVLEAFPSTFDQDQGTLRAPKPIKGTSIYVETKMSAKVIVRRVKDILRYFGYHEKIVNVQIQDQWIPLERIS